MKCNFCHYILRKHDTKQLNLEMNLAASNARLCGSNDFRFILFFGVCVWHLHWATFYLSIRINAIDNKWHRMQCLFLVVYINRPQYQKQNENPKWEMDWNTYLKIHTMITWIYFASLCKIRDVYKCSVFKAETIIIGERFFIIINKIADNNEDTDEGKQNSHRIWIQ